MATTNQNLLFLLSAIGVFNGVLVAAYYFLVQPKKLSNFFLGMMLLMLSLRIWKSVFFYFDPSLPRIVLQIGLSAYFFVGPFLYFFVMEHTQTTQRWLKWQSHLLLLSAVVLSLSVFYPYQTHPKVWSYFARFTQYQWPLYIIAAVLIARGNLRKLFAREHKISQDEVWLVSILLGNFLIWLAHFTAPYTSYIAGSLSFTFVFYLFGIVLFYRRQAQSQQPSIKYADKKIPLALAEPLIEKLDALMLEQQPFKNANLSMPLLAKQLGIATQVLSQLLNDNLQKSFSQYINELRIKAAIDILVRPKPMKMDELAYDCGFNSQSTFYAAFKKQTGTTPAKFREENLKQSSV